MWSRPAPSGSAAPSVSGVAAHLQRAETLFVAEGAVAGLPVRIVTDAAGAALACHHVLDCSDAAARAAGVDEGVVTVLATTGAGANMACVPLGKGRDERARERAAPAEWLAHVAPF